MESPKLEYAFELRIQALPLPETVMTAKGIRRIVSITGGSFEGPQIKGTIIPGGYDWQLMRNDGVIEIEARYVLQTDEGVLITIVNKGLRHASEDVMRRMSEGEDIDPSLYYFRSTFQFETSEPKYDWLIKNIFIANGIRKPTMVIIEVWKVL